MTDEPRSALDASNGPYPDNVNIVKDYWTYIADWYAHMMLDWSRLSDAVIAVQDGCLQRRHSLQELCRLLCIQLVHQERGQLPVSRAAAAYVAHAALGLRVRVFYMNSVGISTREPPSRTVLSVFGLRTSWMILDISYWFNGFVCDLNSARFRYL